MQAAFHPDLIRFNGAAVRRPRRVVAGLLLRQPFLVLQRGRGPETAESIPVFRQMLAIALLQRGRGPETAESPSRRRMKHPAMWLQRGRGPETAERSPRAT
jgi:hypothetical protein